jgi:hypothetical protein
MLKLIVVLTLALFSIFAFGQAPSPADVGIFVKISEILSALPQYISLAVGLFSAIIAIALIIPGEQPEKFLQSCVDFLSKFSKKS